MVVSTTDVDLVRRVHDFAYGGPSRITFITKRTESDGHAVDLYTHINLVKLCSDDLPVKREDVEAIAGAVARGIHHAENLSRNAHRAAATLLHGKSTYIYANRLFDDPDDDLMLLDLFNKVMLELYPDASKAHAIRRVAYLAIFSKFYPE